MKPTTALRIAAITGFLAVALGAFGAHNLRELLEANHRTEIWEKAAHYHLVHAVVLLVLALRPTVTRLSFTLFGVGIVIFSGSLYLLAVTNIRWLGAITPIGGACLIAGWLTLAICPREQSGAANGK
jgi:uncharacterized membrane protein YgdD (TMEM256/DUF423 family)